MSTKTIARVIFFILSITLTLSFFGCAEIEAIVNDMPKITEFTSDIISITSITDPEQAKAKATELIHPNSGFTVETILEKAQADEDLAGIDINQIASQGYSIGSFSSPKIKANDPVTGGNVYELTVGVTLGDQQFTVTLDVLSDSAGFGLYDFDISK